MTDGSHSVDQPSRDPSFVPVSRYFLFAIIAAVGCYLDLLSKRLVFHWRGMPQESPIWWLWDDKIGIETALNTGALFGLGQDKVLFFGVFSIVALAGVVVWFVYARVGHDLLLTIILGCVTAGIMGNLYDRLGMWEPTYLHGMAAEGVADEARIFAVRDWIRLSYGKFVWPNFNVADCLLVVGAAMLVWHSVRAPKADDESSAKSNLIRLVDEA